MRTCFVCSPLFCFLFFWTIKRDEQLRKEREMETKTVWSHRLLHICSTSFKCGTINLPTEGPKRTCVKCFQSMLPAYNFNEDVQFLHKWVFGPSAVMEGKDSWPILQPAARGRSNSFAWRLSILCLVYISSPSSTPRWGCAWTEGVRFLWFLQRTVFPLISRWDLGLQQRVYNCSHWAQVNGVYHSRVFRIK